jgi:hypothetical protein
MIFDSNSKPQFVQFSTNFTTAAYGRNIDIERKIKLLKVCYVPTTSATFLAFFFFFFLLWPLTVLMKQTRQAVCAIKQSILLRCLCVVPTKLQLWLSR